MQFSIEVTPKVDVSQIPNSVREVSITYLPGADDRDVVAQAVRLRQLGFDPIPHVPARTIRDRAHLTRYLSALRQEAQIRQVLIIGGSPIALLAPIPLPSICSKRDSLTGCGSAWRDIPKAYRC